MNGLRRFLDDRGFTTWSRTYPSRRLGVGYLADSVAGWIREDLGNEPVVGITHSLGGIIARHIGDRVNWDGLLMLGPPNRGSRVAKALRPIPLYRWLMGPAGQQVSDAGGWPAPPKPFAVIAGTAGATLGNVPSWLVGTLRLIPQDVRHDGTVTVEEAALEGMASYAEVLASHTWLMNHPRTRELALRFLRQRSFDEPTQPSEIP